MDTIKKLTRTQIVIGTVIVIALIASLVGWKLMERSENVGESATPKKTLTIAGHRMISACQALPETAVGKIYGELGPKSYIDEQYVDKSFSKDLLTQIKKENIDAECDYFLDNAANSTVKLTVSQYVDEALATEAWRNALELGDGSTDRRISEYQTLLDALKNEPADPNPELEERRQSTIAQTQQLIDNMKRSLPEAKRQGGTSVSGLDETILFNPSRGTFMAVYQNSVIKLDYKFGSDNFFDEDRAIQPSEVSQVLSRVKQTYDGVFKNIEDTSLSQSPSSAFRKENVTKVGSTQILDPCEVLSDEVTKLAFGAPSNEVFIDRLSTRKDVTDNRTHVDGHPLLAANECTKHYRKLADTDSKAAFDTGLVTLELAYASSPERAKAYTEAKIKQYEGRAGKLSDATIGADFAKFYDFQSPQKEFGFQAIYFQKGSYAGYLTISKNLRTDKWNDVYSDKATFETTLQKVIESLPKPQ